MKLIDDRHEGAVPDPGLAADVKFAAACGLSPTWPPGPAPAGPGWSASRRWTGRFPPRRFTIV